MSTSAEVAPSPRQPNARTRLVVDISMLALAVASLVLVFYEITSEAHLTAEQRFALDAVDLVIVLIFLSEFIWSARRSGAPWSYVKSNWYDLPSMIWLPGSLFQGFVSLRLLRFVRLVRIVRAAARLHRISGHVRRGVFQQRLLYIGTIALATILFGGMSAYAVEHDTNSLFGNFGDALWWAIVTTTTVGYGDVYPITLEGRLVGVVLMIVGVGIIGTLAGTMAQTLLDRGPTRSRKRIYSRWHRDTDD